MAKGPVTRLVHRLMDQPWVFDLQQAVFNDYDRVRHEFSGYLDKPGLRILDIGCSTGSSAQSLVDMARQDYTGIELMPGYAAVAAARNPLGKVLAMDARRMNFADQSFDLALFVGVWHHMDDETVRAALSEVRRVLRPQGRLLVAEPLFTPGRAVSNFFLRRDRGEHIRDEDAYVALTQGWQVDRRRSFRFSIHRFLSLVLAPAQP